MNSIDRENLNRWIDGSKRMGFDVEGRTESGLWITKTKSGKPIMRLRYHPEKEANKRFEFENITYTFL